MSLSECESSDIGNECWLHKSSIAGVLVYNANEYRVFPLVSGGVRHCGSVKVVVLMGVIWLGGFRVPPLRKLYDIVCI